MADDWLNQATPVTPQAPADDWLSAAAPVHPNFANVQGGVSDNIGPTLDTASSPEMALDVTQPINDLASDTATTAQGALDDTQYQNEQLDVPKPAGMRGHNLSLEMDQRPVGPAESFARMLGAGTADLGDLVSYSTPAGFLQHVNQRLTGQPTPGQSAEETAALNPVTERYSGVRAELAGALGENIPGFLPAERLAKWGGNILKGLNDTLRDAKLAGELGPAAQGSATADEIIQQALEASPANPDKLKLSADDRVPAADLPDAALDESAAPAMQAPVSPRNLADGEGAPPAAGPEAGLESAQPAPQETTPTAQPVAENEPDVLTHDDIDAMVSQGQLSPETAAQLKRMAGRDEAAAETPQDYRAADGSVPEPAWTGATVARDETGAPATLYRGSRTGTTDANAFQELGAATGHPSAQLGVFFTDDAADAGRYGQVGEYHLDLRNPKVYDAADFPGFDTPEEAAALRTNLEAQGHDGIVMDASRYGGPKQYIAFEPHQVITPREGVSAADRAAGVRASLRDEEPIHAESLREGEGPTGSAGEAAQGSEVGGGGDLQQAREAERNPDAQQLRQAGEGRDAAANAVRDDLTGIYNKRAADERAWRGLEEIRHDLGRGDEQVWSAAKDRLAADPDAGRNLARELIETKRPPSAEDIATLTLDRARIKNERRAAVDRASAAMDSGDAATVQKERANIKRLDDEYHVSDLAGRASGAEQGLAFRARQLMSRDDYSMSQMVRDARVQKGSDLTAKETADLEAKAKDIEAREKALAQREADLRNARARPKNPFAVKNANDRFDALVAELKKTPDREQLTPGCVI